MNFETKVRTAVAVYAICGLIIFGHCAVFHPMGGNKDEDGSGTAIKASLAGLLWPAYVSIRLWETAR